MDQKFDNIKISIDLEWQNAAINVTPVQKWSDAVGDSKAATTVQSDMSLLSLFNVAS